MLQPTRTARPAPGSTRSGPWSIAWLETPHVRKGAGDGWVFHGPSTPASRWSRDTDRNRRGSRLREQIRARRCPTRCFRHTAAPTFASTAGGNAFLILENLLGHKTTAMTNRYVKSGGIASCGGIEPIRSRAGLPARSPARTADISDLPKGKGEAQGRDANGGRRAGARGHCKNTHLTSPFVWDAAGATVRPAVTS